ncbi:hypothetical protein GJAV_G00246340 [Gymnothorax javanicus]|nr:hypothetical protein GJAV_G00246340 [Gymnothorax javanicus]
MSSTVSFQAQLAYILDVLAKSAVAEITKLVDDRSAALRLEMCRSKEENDALKRKLLLMERKLTTVQEQGAKALDNSLDISFEVKVCDEFRESQCQNTNRLATEKFTRGRFESCGSFSTEMEDSVSLPTLIKSEPEDGEQEWSESLLLSEDTAEEEPNSSKSLAKQKISEENSCAAAAGGGEGPLCEKDLFIQSCLAGNLEGRPSVEPKLDPDGWPLAPGLTVHPVWSAPDCLGTVPRQDVGRDELRDEKVKGSYCGKLLRASSGKRFHWSTREVDRVTCSAILKSRKRKSLSTSKPDRVTDNEPHERETIAVVESSRSKYEAQRKRQWLPHWQFVYPFAQYDKKAAVMYCQICRQYPDMAQGNRLFHGVPLTSKEKTARYRARINNDPIARAEKLAKRRERYWMRKAKGIVDRVPISRLSAEEMERKRTQWRLAKKKSRERQRRILEAANRTAASKEPGCESSDASTYVCVALEYPS